VTDIEHLPFDSIPSEPLKRDLIAKVRCEYQQKRQFIVEMQMIWTADFFKRVLFNSSKADGMPVSLIAKYTGLNEDQVSKL